MDIYAFFDQSSTLTVIAELDRASPVAQPLFRRCAHQEVRSPKD
jgi:hypothetical protein